MMSYYRGIEKFSGLFPSNHWGFDSMSNTRVNDSGNNVPLVQAYGMILPISVYRVLREWLLKGQGGARPGGKGQTATKNRGETIYLKDFEEVKSLVIPHGM